MAADLILILRDFFTTEPDERTRRSPGRLPALERLLSAAQRRPLGTDWRAALATRVPLSQPVTASQARIVARAFQPEAAAAAGCWLVTPVHYFAGLDSLHLHPEGILELDPAEQSALAADFNRLFADLSWRLWPTGRRELLLTGPALAVHGQDPARWLGSRLDRAAAAGREASELQRLCVEIEMWLHEQPLNRMREAGGRLRIIGLWPWGAQPLPTAAGSHVAASDWTLWGQDTFAAALWRLAGAHHEAQAPLTPAALGRRGTHVVLIPGGFPVEPMLETLEARWMTPALAALRSGALGSIELWAGAHAFRLRRLHLARFWRGRASWQQVLA